MRRQDVLEEIRKHLETLKEIQSVTRIEDEPATLGVETTDGWLLFVEVSNA